MKKVLDLLAEVEMYSFYKRNLKRGLKQLFDEYQAGKTDYFTYEKNLKRLLKGKTEDELIQYYNSYILSLLKRIETYNSEIFYEAYKDKRYAQVPMEGAREAKPAVKPAPRPEPRPLPRPAPRPEPMRVERVQAPEPRPAVPAVEEGLEVPEMPPTGPVLVEVKPSLFDRMTMFFKGIFVKKEVEKHIEELKAGAKPGAKQGKKLEVKKGSAFEVMWKKPVPTIEQPKARPAAGKKDEGAVGIGGGFGIGWFKNLFARKEKVEFSAKKSEVQMSTLQMETLRRRAQPEISAQIEKITATALTREAKRIRDIMERRKSLKIYHPSFFGSLANLTIKRISLFLLDTFPDFFKDLYHALRLANIKLLSNTYVNIMVLGVLSAFIAGLAFFGFFFSTTPLPPVQILLRTFMMSGLLGLITFAGFYAYPYSLVKQRRRSINTNLPFAINHMAAVSASGVAPTKMFKLISQSKEYGEVSEEVEKIVNYIEVFGYDVLTGIKAVAATTPSYQFKDFFEGMVSTTQTGGDISSFLSQKAGEAMLNYKLERKKYTETISTYSDIYTGILIAAPLFFVAALSLVSLLGGKIGGIDVNIIIVLGTYVIIPVLNIGFLTFLELTQPEI